MQVHDTRRSQHECKKVFAIFSV